MAQTLSEHSPPLSCATTNDFRHSRTVQRTCQVFAVPEQLQHKWTGLKTFVVVERSGQRDGAKRPPLGGDRQSFHERQFYICSQCLDAEQLLADTQGHWGIENRLHWVRDVQFEEDFPPRRGGNAPVNWAILHNFLITSALIFRFPDYSPSPTCLIQSTRANFFSACMKPPCPAFRHGVSSAIYELLRPCQRRMDEVSRL